MILQISSIKNISESLNEEVELIKIFGGEFLLLSYGMEVIKILRKFFNSAKIIAYTNGKLFLKDKRLFEKVRPDGFHVSIDQWHNNV